LWVKKLVPISMMQIIRCFSWLWIQNY
jgi:hypothetical protein